MNADRMIAVFLAGVLVGGTTVYLSPNNSLSVGMPGGKQGGTDTNGGGAGAPAGGQVSAAAQAATPAGDIGASAGGGAQGGSAGEATAAGGAASGLSAASDGMAGAGPGAPGDQQTHQGGGSGRDDGAMGGGGMSGGMGGGMGTPGEGGMPGGGGVMGGESDSSTISSVPVAGAPRGATRLLRHLQVAPTLWKAQAETASASKDPAVRALAARIAEHVSTIPTVNDRMPPNTEVVTYLVDSKLLIERMKLAGMDVASLESQVDEVSRARR